MSAGGACCFNPARSFLSLNFQFKFLSLAVKTKKTANFIQYKELLYRGFLQRVRKTA
jgi:hypothetical protein